jgi:hypothetical protein
METEPTSAPDQPTEAATASDSARPIKQMLAWAVGDREMEAEALAKETAETTGVPKEVALEAARHAIADAHGDTGVAEKGSSSSDVARPSDVEAVIDAESAD